MESHTPERRSFAFAPGVSISYEVHGAGGDAALLLHGFGVSSEAWRDLQPYLEPHLRLYLLDLKGFGLSSAPRDGAYSIQDQAAIVAAFMERLQLPPLTLIGHSYGGSVALATCLNLTGAALARVRSLVLIGAPAAVQTLPFFVRWLRSPIPRRVLRSVPARIRARYLLRRLYYDPRKITGSLVRRYERFVDPPAGSDGMVAAALQIVPDPPDSITARLAGLRRPVLLVWGDHDNVIFRWQADVLKGALPDSRLVILPRCGHLAPEEDPEGTAQAILGFLVAHAPGPPSPA